MDFMSNIIFLLSSIRVKMNVNEMENGKAGRGEAGRSMDLITVVVTSLGQVKSGGEEL